jgi:hypothetical protein
MPISASLREKLHRIGNKNFLYKVFTLQQSNQRKRKNVFAEATLQEVDLLIQILRALLKEDIPVRGSEYPRIKKSGKLRFLVANFFEDSGYSAVVASSLEEKKEVLKKITVYPQLLRNLFYK